MENKQVQGSLLRAESLRKEFNRVQAVRNASLAIASQEIVALMGRSGSGKTTTLNLLAGLERPTSGKVIYCGEEITSLDEDALALWRRKHIGMVFQAFHLIPSLSALENVAFPLYPVRMPAGRRRERAAASLDAVGLSHRSGHLPSRLSGGEQQRVAIARALVNAPGLILADEPTGNLDSQTGEEILAQFQRLRDEQGVAFLIVTHDDQVARMVDRTILMKDGEVVDDQVG
jgi:putative ABC transport system ATP-binding protein